MLPIIESFAGRRKEPRCPPDSEPTYQHVNTPTIMKYVRVVYILVQNAPCATMASTPHCSNKHASSTVVAVPITMANLRHA